MKKFTTLLAVFITFLTTVQAQKRELGNVTIEELKEKIHPKDSSAAAAYIFNKGKTYFQFSENTGFSLVTDVEVKIKIYKKEGYDWANKSVNYYVGNNNNSSKETVVINKAATYNLINGKIEKTKLKSEGEFSESINKFWNVKKITLPDVKEGSIIEYSYTIKSPFISNLPDWGFQKTIPVNYSEFKTEIPEYFIYNPFFKGSLTPKIEKNGVNKTITLNNKQRSDGYVTSTQFSTETINYIENHTLYVLENIAAIKNEGFVNNLDNYLSTISNELISKQMPNQTYTNFATNWEDVSKNIYENDDFGPQLNKNNYFEDDLKTLLQGLTTFEEKSAAIFNFVQSRMVWNKSFSYICDSGVKKAYQEKTGNTADINLMLVSMLRYANLDANPVLLSTRNNGIALYPSRTAFNMVIASVVLNNKIVLLDATSKYSQPNILPLRDLNWFGRIIRKDGTSDMIDLMPESISQDVVNVIATIDTNGKITGKFREQYLDYCALRFRESYTGLAKESIVEKIEKSHSGLEVEDYELTTEPNLNESVIEKYTFKNSNSSEIIGNKIYISPLLHLVSTENPFKQETREYPIDFSFPFKDKYMISITIPDGYQLESIPKPISISMDKEYGNFSFTTSNSDNQVQIIVVLSINTSIIPPDDYSTLKEFFKIIVDKENEKIVLIKK